MKSGFKKVIFFFLILSAMSCANIFAGGARKTTDAAKFFDAKIKVNQREWQAAIDLIESTTSKFRARRDVKFLLASAYGGMCGLDFLAIAQRLTQQGGSSNLFQMLVSVIKGGTQNGKTANERLIDYCSIAMDTINGIDSDPQLRTADENTLAAFIGLTTAAVAIADIVDTDGDGNLDGGAPSICTIGDVEAELGLLGTTLAYFSLQEVGGTIGQATVAAMTAMCTDLSAPGTYNFCDSTEAPVGNADYLRGWRGMARETNNGFGMKTYAGTAEQAAVNCP